MNREITAFNSVVAPVVTP